MMIRVGALTALVLVLLFGPPVAATVVIPVEFRQMVAESALIVRGRITDVRAIRVPGRGVETVGTVAVGSVLKGQAGNFVSVRVPGGVIGRYRFTFVGAPTLRVGAEAVYFLARGDDDGWRPIGLTQGIFGVRLDASGRASVQPPVVPGTNAPDTGRILRGDVRRRAMPVPEFESLVRTVLAGPPRAVPRRGGR